jgi:hypothetical protein
MEKVFQSRWFHLWAAAFIAAVTLIVYSNTFNASFHFDDTPQIVENYLIRDIGNLPEILKGTRGVTMATFAVNYAIGGLDVVGYHIVNTLVHIINGVLAYLVLFFTLMLIGSDEAKSKKIAAFAAVLFVAHPIQTQAVTYIVQRMESMASMFYLLALVLFIRGAGATTQAKRIALYAGVAASYVLGFYSKEIAVTLPFIVFLYDFYFLSAGDVKGPAGRWPLYAVLSILLAIFVWTTLIPAGGFGDLSEESAGASAGFGVKGISPLEYLYTQFNVIVYYITLLVAPLNQNLDYDFPISTSLFSVPQIKPGTVLNYPLPPPFVSLLILLAIAAAGVYLFMRARRGADKRMALISFFIFWFFVILSPTSSFIPIIDVIFEHRLYLASLGFFAIFAVCFEWFFDCLEKRRSRG